MGHQNAKATIELRNAKEILYQDVVNLRNGAQQTFDLTQVANGTYQIQITIGQEVTTRTIQVERVQERSIRLS
jgi:hypothetical protein